MLVWTLIARDSMPFDAAHLDWPTFGMVADVRPALAEALAGGRAVALATIHRGVGSAPRGVGAQMLIEPDRLTGYLSGGCLEADVAGHAMRALADSQPRRLVYGHGSPFRDIRLPCGGRLELLVEAIAPNDPAAWSLVALAAERRPSLWISDGRDRRCEPAPQAEPPLAVREEPFEMRLRGDPAPRLVVVGSDPIALAVARMGVVRDLETWLVRPKGPPDPPFAGVHYLSEEPAAALNAIGLDRWTAVVAASHDPEIDEPALVAAFGVGVGYIGVLGARGRIVDRRTRLSAAGVSEADLDRLHAPIGLDIGARSPWEIAVAVHAEIIASTRAAAVQAVV